MSFNILLTTMIIPQIIYKMEYNKTKAKGYTLPYDTPHQQHMKKVKDITSNVSPAQTARTFKTFFKRGTGNQNMKSIFAFGGVFFIHLAAEVQRSVWEEQGPDQHGPWGSWDPCCQGGLQEHHQCKCLWWRYREISLSVQCWPKINLTYPLLLFFWFQLDYKKKYEATKSKWIWTADRPDFLNAAKNSLQQSDVS